MNTIQKRNAALAAAVVAVAGGSVWADVASVDNFQTIVTKAKAVYPADSNGTRGALGAFAYDPATDSIYTIGFTPSIAISKIGNASGGDANQTVTLEVGTADYTTFYRGGSTTATSFPTAFSFLLNPKTIGTGDASIPAYSKAWVLDIGVVDKNTPSLTKRIYSYNLGQAVAGGGGSDVLGGTPSVTKAAIAAAAGQAGSATDNPGRQFAWSGDGQSLYYFDSLASTSFGGIYRANPATGGVTRILQTSGSNFELSVQQVGSNQDRIYLPGSSSLGNAGGLSSVDYTYGDATVGSAQTVVTAADLQSFLETSGTTSLLSSATDSSGNVYFTVKTAAGTDANGNAVAANSVLIQRDAQGRMSKVLSLAERTAALGSLAPNGSSPARLQPRTLAYTNADGKSFQTTQILYAELGTASVVAGANVFKPGDFDRDNTYSLADTSLFRTALNADRAVTTGSVTAADLKFDLNGNGLVNYKDVKLLQQFLDLGNADANLDGVVDARDFLTLQNNYDLTGRIFTEGDFNGDGVVNAADFLILQNSYGFRSSVLGAGVTADLSALPATLTAVPEPAAMSIVGLVGLALGRRRRRS